MEHLHRYLRNDGVLRGGNDNLVCFDDAQTWEFLSRKLYKVLE